MPPPTPLALRRLAFRLPPATTTRSPTLLRTIHHVNQRPAQLSSRITCIRAFSSTNRPHVQKSMIDWDKSKEWLNDNLSFDRLRASFQPTEEIQCDRRKGERYPPHFMAYKGMIWSIIAGGSRLGAILCCAYMGTLTPMIFHEAGFFYALFAFSMTTVPVMYFNWTVPLLPSKIYLDLPPYARISRHALNQYVYSLNPSTPLIIMTHRWSARPLLTKVCIGDLTFQTRRMGYANAIADVGNGKEKLFMIPKEANYEKADEAGVWAEVAAAIEKYTKLKKELGVPAVGKKGDDKWWNVMWEHWELERPEPRVILPGVKLEQHPDAEDYSVEEGKFKPIRETPFRRAVIKTDETTRKLIMPVKKAEEADRKSDVKTDGKKVQEFGKAVKKVVLPPKPVRKVAGIRKVPK